MPNEQNQDAKDPTPSPKKPETTSPPQEPAAPPTPPPSEPSVEEQAGVAPPPKKEEPAPPDSAPPDMDIGGGRTKEPTISDVQTSDQINPEGPTEVPPGSKSIQEQSAEKLASSKTSQVDGFSKTSKEFGEEAPPLSGTAGPAQTPPEPAPQPPSTKERAQEFTPPSPPSKEQGETATGSGRTPGVEPAEEVPSSDKEAVAGEVQKIIEGEPKIPKGGSEEAASQEETAAKIESAREKESQK